ncbi:preprotein translocase subunit SecG [Candidatus Peregrinibacteria bacterium CG_4_9_14_0_2_um_filter_53_11]|nr:MAG: preprotein translocase subunit SecG [Candidatus Peregrinibacteria bacterium CG_4_9_14_0_2_um_filter_53_11]
MEQFLTITQITVSVLLILAILMQEKGVGLGASFGGGGEFYKSKRGLDVLLYRATVVLAGLFILTSVAFIFVP